jgi:hypothetical protein
MYESQAFGQVIHSLQLPENARSKLACYAAMLRAQAAQSLREFRA